jgi:hypothetical protein
MRSQQLATYHGFTNESFSSRSLIFTSLQVGSIDSQSGLGASRSAIIVLRFCAPTIASGKTSEPPSQTQSGSLVPLLAP